MTLDDVMESICDRCRYALEAQEQDELDDICAACTIPADIEELVRQETGHTAVFKTWFTAVQEDFRRLEEAAGWVSEKDPEKGDKLAGAVRALLAQQQEAWA